MRKTNKIILLILLLILPLLAFSQYSGLPTSTQKEINRLNKKIHKSFRKDNSFSKKDTTVQLFTFFSFGTMDTISKEELIDGSFLQRFKRSYYYYSNGKSQKKYPYSFFHADAFIYSSNEKVIATFLDSRFESIINENYHRLPCFDALVKHIWNQKKLLVFRMHIGDGCTYFIVNEQLEIYVFYDERKNGLLSGNYKIVSMSEYLNAIGIDYLNARGGRIRN